MHEVPEATDEPSIVHRVHLLRRALTSELQLLLHGRGSWVVVLHLPQLENNYT